MPRAEILTVQISLVRDLVAHVRLLEYMMNIIFQHSRDRTAGDRPFRPGEQNPLQAGDFYDSYFIFAASPWSLRTGASRHHGAVDAHAGKPAGQYTVRNECRLLCATRVTEAG